VWLARLDEEADNIRAALVWTAAAGDRELALRLAGALVRFWSTRGLMGEGRRLLREAFATGGEVAPATLAKAQFAAGYAALGEGDFAEAKQAFEASLASAGGDQAAALAQLAWLAMASGGADARELAERSLSLAETAGDGLTQSGALGTLAELAAGAGDYDEAIRLLDRGLALRRALGDKRLVGNSLLALGRAELLRGELDRATTLLEESLTLARSVKDTWSNSVALVNLGRVRLCQGDTPAARSLFDEGLGLVRERNDRRVAAELLQGLAAVLVLEGRPADGARVLGAAESLREATGAAPSPAETMIATRFLAPLHEGYEEQLAIGSTLGIDAALSLASPGKV
jgi:tetratricopeptide (TPR) repeat protein